MSNEIEYHLSYRLVGEGSMTDAVRVRVLDFPDLFDNGRRKPARTDEEASRALREFVDRPWARAEVEVISVTKVVTTKHATEVPWITGRRPQHLPEANGHYWLDERYDDALHGELTRLRADKDRLVTALTRLWNAAVADQADPDEMRRARIHAGRVLRREARKQILLRGKKDG